MDHHIELRWFNSQQIACHLDWYQSLKYIIFAGNKHLEDKTVLTTCFGLYFRSRASNQFLWLCTLFTTTTQIQGLNARLHVTLQGRIGWTIHVHKESLMNLDEKKKTKLHTQIVIHYCYDTSIDI